MQDLTPMFPDPHVSMTPMFPLTFTNVTEGQSMFMLDMPTSLPEQTVLMAQAAPVSSQQQKMAKITLEQSWIVPSDSQYQYTPGWFVNSLSASACAELLEGAKFKSLGWKSPTCKVIEILALPRHGVLVNEGNDAYGLKPTPGYLGRDRIQYIVEGVDGRRVLITMPIDFQTMAKAFSLKNSSGVERNSEIAAWSLQVQLSAILSTASGVTYTFENLPSTAVGETTGQGLSAQITLDTNAAGHGWYIDPTPLDNSDDYLPTSDPMVWQAKAGSAAAGKMDMLSVLLHEYGHALGLEHSANGADFMAASLQPGVRKLPSAAELTLMSQLVAELKNAGGEALTLALSQGERGQDNPSSPLPSPSPLSALGLLPFGLMRRNGGNGSANAGVATGAATASHIDYLTAINTTLANGSFNAGQNGTIDQWESVGNVAATPANASQAVTLGESTTAQAHLAQAFVLSAQDRFLTFTVSGLDLQTNSIEQGDVFTAAPQDAFEVALQNANTGANLLANGAGGVGNYPF